ncbi:hypothetical protein [Bacteroides cellulosilyticus]|uniref:hypothetical protein n=1 Tax=Bacteroides cellulosilyticus TaxID=246787 RepID=UPI001898507A|nr:hypothetical protein [Bacteroides cellulosilyticus]
MLLLYYAGGLFRLYGTFECFSNLLPRITPNYNYTVFLSFVFFVVLGCIHVFDWVAIQFISITAGRIFICFPLLCAFRPLSW